MIFQAVLTAALAASSFHGAAAKSLRRQYDLSTRIETEAEVALSGVLNNIGPNGNQAPGAAAGAVIASPSMENPDCNVTYFTSHNSRTDDM